jgi:hypothetical protein
MKRTTGFIAKLSVTAISISAVPLFLVGNAAFTPPGRVVEGITNSICTSCLRP